MLECKVKKTWVRPALMVYGDVVKLTQGLRDGESTDAAFPIKTPKKQLTFS
jgi:hypothetical protein